MFYNINTRSAAIAAMTMMEVSNSTIVKVKLSTAQIHPVKISKLCVFVITALQPLSQ
jgi:hypothetical protein